MNWDLIAWSFAVVRKHKQLVLFPIFSAAAALAALYLCSQWGHVPFQRVLQSHRAGIRDYVWLAPAYLVVSFAMIFFNCALAACAQAHFSGAEPTVRYGLRFAGARLAPIFAWALLAATVGFILNTIEHRASWAGKLIIWIFGFAWGMATYLVVPVLIAEDRGAFGSLRRSAQLFRETWGDQIVAELRFGWRALLLFIPCLVLGALGANGYPILLPATVVYFFIAAATLSAAMEIFRVALYRYAALGETPADWSPEILSGILQSRSTISTRILDI
jgi:hypothetical protein